MKFDKTTTIAIVICVIVLFVWEPVARRMGWIAAPQASAVPAAVAPAAPAVQIPIAPTATPAEETVKLAPLPAQTLSNKQQSLTFNPLEGSIEKITLPGYRNAAQDGPIIIDQSMTGIGALSVYDATAAWNVAHVVVNRIKDDTYTLVRQIRTAGGEFLLTQEWKLAPDFQTDYKISIKNLGKQPLVFGNLVVNGGDLAPWAMISGDFVRIASHRMDLLTSSGKYLDLKADKDDADFFLTPPPQVRWASVGNKYFCSILTANEPFLLHQARAGYIRTSGSKPEMILTAGATIPNLVLSAGESKALEFRFYSGPKVIADLKAFDPSTARVMHLAWGPLDYLARLLLWVLVELHNFCGSYGLSIIILTLMVRILFYPVTAKANMSMKRMQAVQPKLKELREKYKDNPQMLNTKMMELYRTEKINPFGGCLPILLQIPVFFALYATLDGAVELRQVSFLWATNLAAPDTVARIPLYFIDYSIPINPFVLMMTALMVIQQRMMPMSMDPMQKKMMMAMPVVMLVFLYDLPSGLTLYWTVSNFFSIIQMRLQQRNNHTQGTEPEKAAAK